MVLYTSSQPFYLNAKHCSNNHCAPHCESSLEQSEVRPLLAYSWAFCKVRPVAGQTLVLRLIRVILSSSVAGFCILRHLNSPNLPPKYLELGRRLAGSQLYWWFFSSLSGLSLLIEDKHRREELAMYVLPKAGESAWITFREEILGIKSRRKGAWKADVAVSSDHI